MENELDLHAIQILRPDVRVNLITETELAAAELLVQLSESASTRDSSSSTTSSPRSVNTWLNIIEEEEEEEMMVVLPRRRKRYRSIHDLYRSTACLGRDEEEIRKDDKRKNKKRLKVEEEGERGVAML